MDIEAAAIALHHHYRALYPGLPGWSELPEAKKELNRAQVRTFSALREQFGDDIEALAAGAHDVWMQHTANKTDPRMVPYEQLPEEEKQKDRDVVEFLMTVNMTKE
jgi:hypothetical protein